MNHYTLRTISGTEYEFYGDSIVSFMGASSSYGEVYKIPARQFLNDDLGAVDSTIWIMRDKVESVTEWRCPEENDEWANVNIENLDLSVRSFNGLRRAGVYTVKDLLDYVEKRGKLTGIRSIGPNCACEIAEKLKSQYGLDMRTGEATDDT